MGGGSTSSTKSKKSSGGGDPGVECILDPSKCGGGSSSKKSAPKKAAADPNLPEKLTSSDIKAGVGPHKGAAKSCGGKHGAASGEKVTVKLSIAGATGKVTSASAIGKHAGTPARQLRGPGAQEGFVQEVPEVVAGRPVPDPLLGERGAAASCPRSACGGAVRRRRPTGAKLPEGNQAGRRG